MLCTLVFFYVVQVHLCMSTLVLNYGEIWICKNKALFVAIPDIIVILRYYRLHVETRH